MPIPSMISEIELRLSPPATVVAIWVAEALSASSAVAGAAVLIEDRTPGAT